MLWDMGGWVGGWEEEEEEEEEIEEEDGIMHIQVGGWVGGWAGRTVGLEFLPDVLELVS